MTICASRQDLRQVAIAFVGDDDRGTGFGDEKVRAGDPDVGGQEFGPQHLARFSQQLFGFGKAALGQEIAMRLAEFLLDVFCCQMDRGRDDVGGAFATQLNDVFAKVGLDRLDPSPFERVIEVDLLGDHRLALGDGARAHGLAEFDDDLARFLGVLRVVDLAAARADLALVGLEIKVEVGERVILDRLGAVAQSLKFGQSRGGRRSSADEIAREGHRALQSGVGQRLMRVLFELGRCRDATHRAASGLPSPIAGPSAIPARISATWRALTFEPSR